jgi:co-chaperonin GroES (HSP10)
MNAVKGKIIPLRDNVLVSDMNFAEQKTASGIIIRSDNGKTEGIKPRWGQVWAIGPDQQDVKIGDWICVEHGRWTRGITVENPDGTEIIVRMVDNDCIMLCSNERPNDVDIRDGI